LTICATVGWFFCTLAPPPPPVPALKPPTDKGPCASDRHQILDSHPGCRQRRGDAEQTDHAKVKVKMAHWMN
jgi:hypothetical protein